MVHKNWMLLLHAWAEHWLKFKLMMVVTAAKKASKPQLKVPALHLWKPAFKPTGSKCQILKRCRVVYHFKMYLSEGGLDTVIEVRNGISWKWCAPLMRSSQAKWPWCNVKNYFIMFHHIWNDGGSLSNSLFICNCWLAYETALLSFLFLCSGFLI